MYTSNCAYCGAQFTVLRPRECCQRSCSGKLKHQRLGTEWSQDAELWLEQKAGTMPLPNLTAAYNRAAVKHGWAKRSLNSIKLKLKRLNLSRKCTENNITRYELARVLEISPDKVRVWTKNGLPYRKVARNQTAIKISDVRAFLLNNPSRAFGVSFDGLSWLIGEIDATAICEADHSRRGHRRPVVNLDTGKVYPGVKAAARENHLTHNCIAQSIQRGGRSGGCRWAYVDQVMPKAIKPVANLDALLEATADLESGHSIEAVLAQHGIPARHSAYDVVRRYQKNLAYYEGSTTTVYQTMWLNACKELEPVIKAIAKHLEEQQHD